MTPDDQAAAQALLREVYAGVTAAVEPLAGRDLARPTRAARWDVAALLQHLLMDAQRALVALSTPRDDEATVDEVTYWRPFRPSTGDGGAAYADVVTALARAHPEAALVDAWRSTARAAASVPVPGRQEGSGDAARASASNAQRESWWSAVRGGG